MKQLAAILFLGILFFNLFGYRIISYFLENRENQKMELALDNNEYSDAQLISIKQPIKLPYYQNSAFFQRIDGEIEIDGVSYKYVKRRIYNDSLELLCIPNMGKMKIQADKDNFSKLASDFQQPNNKKQSPSKSFQNPLTEFEDQQSPNASTFNPPSFNFFLRNDIFVTALFSKSPGQPPDPFSNTLLA